MLQSIKNFFKSSMEENGVFERVRAIVVLLLVITFQGATIYIMVSGLL